VLLLFLVIIVVDIGCVTYVPLNVVVVDTVAVVVVLVVVDVVVVTDDFSSKSSGIISQPTAINWILCQEYLSMFNL
jgi:hypothetical protein